MQNTNYQKQAVELIKKNEAEKGYQEVKGLHHPQKTSGVTIGYGTDFRDLKQQQVRKKFQGLVSQKEMNILVKACGLTGYQADKFCEENKNLKLSQVGVTTLLQREINIKKKDLQSLMTNKDRTVIKLFSKSGYNKEIWSKVPNQYKVVLLDMIYNGRNTLETRPHFIPLLIKHVKEIDGGNVEKIKQNKRQLDKKLREMYQKPPGKLIKLSRRANNITNFLKEKPAFSVKQQSIQNPQNEKVKQYLQKTCASISMIPKNNNQLGGIDFGFDIKKFKFSKIHLGKTMCSVNNSNKQSDVSFMDLVVPLKVLNDPNIQAKNICISLDPLVPENPDGPLYKKVYYPLIIEGTPMANAMIEADFLMKQLSLGIDENNKPLDYPKSIKDLGLDLSTLVKKYAKSNQTRNRSRLWIVVKDVQIQQKNRVIQINNIKMGLNAVMQQPDQKGILKDSKDEIPEMTKKFAQIFTQNYDKISQTYHVFEQVKRYAKASILARILTECGCPINYNLINNLFLQMKRQVEKNVPRLQNQVEMKLQDETKILSFKIAGGCDLTASESLASLKSLKQLRNINQAEDLPVQQMKEYIPFLFQSIINCKQNHCSNICNMDYYSTQNQLCELHTNMKCFMCLSLILRGEKYLNTSIDNVKYHTDCMQCMGCCEKMDHMKTQQSDSEDQKIVQKQGLIFHAKCYSHGECPLCNQNITNKQKALVFEQKTVHAQCFDKWKEKAQIPIMNKSAENPVCDKCKKAITGPCLTNKQVYWHPQCVERQKCDVCGKTDNLKMFDGKTVHIECLSCDICKKPLSEQKPTGITNNKKYVHRECFDKK